MPVPSISALRLSGARNRAELPLLLLGPSSGPSLVSSVTDDWWPCVEHLADAFDLLAWDLPGRGHNRSVPEEPFTMAELAAGVLVVVDDVLAQRDEVDGSFSYAGVGVGGEVGLQLALDAPTRVRDVVLLGLGADRTVAPGSGPPGHRPASEARAGSDVLDRLGEVRVPVLVVAGAEDPLAPLRQVVGSIDQGRLEVLDGLTDPAPGDAPERVAALVRHLALGEPLPGLADSGGAGELSRSLEALAVAHGGGTLWQHPGLDPRTRVLVALTAVVVSGGLEEVASHVGVARSLGIDDGEIREVVLQAALLAAGGDVPAGRRIAGAVLAEVAGKG